MSDADWDADDFEPEVGAAAGNKKVTDKWDGEDEDDDIKDSWDKESEEEDSKGSEDSNSIKAVQRKKKKKMHEIIAEKEAAKMKELEDKARAQADQDFANTPEGKLAEKLKQQKIAEMENLDLARDMLGVTSGSVDTMIPQNKEDFDQLSKAIVEKVQLFSSSSHYQDFVEGLIKDLTLDLQATTLKKIKIHVETLHSTKMKEEKASKAGGKKGGKGRSNVKMDLDKDIFGGSSGPNYEDEYDDFM